VARDAAGGVGGAERRISQAVTLLDARCKRSFLRRGAATRDVLKGGG